MNTIKVNLLLVVTIILASCNTSDKAKNDNSKTKERTQIKTLNDTITNLKSGIENLKYEITSLKSEIDILNNKHSFHSKENYEEIVAKAKEDDVRLIEVLSWRFHISEENHISRSLINNWHKLDTVEMMTYRKKEFLTSFFSDSNLDLITYLLSKNNLYESSKMNLYVNALVDSYQDVDSKFLEELYNLAEEVNDNENIDEIETLLRSVATTDDSDFYKFQSRQATSFSPTFMLYSFWARRHHENNEEIVYDVLRQIQTRMDTIYGEAIYN